MKTYHVTAIAAALTFCVIMLAACAHALLFPRPECPTPPHEWTAWQDEWDKPNGFGIILQRRYCGKCGVVQIETH